MSVYLEGTTTEIWLLSTRLFYLFTYMELSQTTSWNWKVGESPTLCMETNSLCMCPLTLCIHLTPRNQFNFSPDTRPLNWYRSLNKHLPLNPQLQFIATKMIAGREGDDNVIPGFRWQGWCENIVTVWTLYLLNVAENKVLKKNQSCLLCLCWKKYNFEIRAKWCTSVVEQKILVLV